jgi:hypothetical protein
MESLKKSLKTGRNTKPKAAKRHENKRNPGGRNLKGVNITEIIGVWQWMMVKTIGEVYPRGISLGFFFLALD